MISMYLLLVLSLINFSCSYSINEYKTYKDYKFYKVEGDQDGIQNLINIMNDLAEMPFHNVRGSTAHILIAPELVQIFEEAVRLQKLHANVEVDDYSEIIRLEKSGDRADKGFSWTAYYDVDAIYAYLQNLSKAYPDTTEVIVGGESYEGRQLLGLRINTPTQKQESKPVVFIESGIHAREWITPATTTYFINQLMTSQDTNITSLRDQFDWRIFPTVNPDGYTYSFNRDRMWRKTRSKSSSLICYGTDANRNWDYNWLQHGATSNPCDYQTYGGPKPFSEKETSTLSEYISGLENLLAYVAFHSDAQMLLAPYSDSVEHVDNYDDLNLLAYVAFHSDAQMLLASCSDSIEHVDNYYDLVRIQIGKTSLEYGQRVNGEKYDGPGTAAELLYKASGGSMDWVRNALGTQLVYTYELRGTYFHWPPGRIHEQGDEVTQMLLGLFTEAKSLGYF